MKSVTGLNQISHKKENRKDKKKSHGKENRKDRKKEVKNEEEGTGKEMNGRGGRT